MRVAHAEYSPGSWWADHPGIRHDLRSRVGVVLSVDREAAKGTRGEAGGKAGCAIQPVPRDCTEGPITRLRKMLRIFQRVDALEARMDGMAEWLEGRK